MQIRMAMGCIALAAYFLLFSAGLLLSSKPYRTRLQAVNGSAAAVAATAEPGSGETPLPAVGAAPPDATPIRDFVGSALLYSPLNIAFLTLLAGFVGGCASSITFREANGAKDAADAKRAFRTESPFASMFRSFLVYLTFIAGIFITTNAPFENPTADQYARLAGMVSLFGFVVGYDPTKFQDILDMVPKRGKNGS